MKSLSFNLKSLLHLFGGALGLLGIAFVAQRLYVYTDQIDFANFSIGVCLTLVGLVVVYGAANIFLAMGWWNLLLFYDIRSHRQWAIRVYGLSQLAKYVPGNIFHLAGRQAFGLAAGYPGRGLMKSIIGELGLSAVAGLLFGILAIPLLVSTNFNVLALLLFCGAIVGVFYGFKYFLTPDVSKAFAWQTLFLAISGTVFAATLGALAPQIFSHISVLSVAAAFVVAWLVGLVTPGAPAGLGVRELVLMTLFYGQVREVDLLLAIAVGRVITVTGDTLFFTASHFLKK